MKIELHIERLVLEGVNVTPNGQRLLAASLETELSRLMTVHGLGANCARNSALAIVPAAEIAIATPFDATQTGAHLAQSVFGSFASLAPSGPRRP